MVVPPGTLACQKDSTLQQLYTRVNSCELIRNESTDKGEAHFFEVELYDSILFPEGGGQPCDVGNINEFVVDKVYVKNGRSLHRVRSTLTTAKPPFKEDDEVIVTLDWSRRFDHMQQHSAQHLLSAICEKYGYKTTTWSFGEDRCNIELVSFPSNKPINSQECHQSKRKGTVVPYETLEKIEEEINAVILSGKSMTPKFIDKQSPEWKHIASKFDHDHKPEVFRIVEIDGIDSNPCCGTHVQNIAQIQSLRILNTETARGATRVWFVAGGRVNKAFRQMFQREQALTKLLSCGPEDHTERVSKLVQFQRAAAKEIKGLQKEAAAAVAHELQESINQHVAPPKVIHYHRKGADLAFLQSVVTYLGQTKESYVFVLTGGEAAGEGNFCLAGPSVLLDRHGKSVVELIEGKCGKARLGVMQGKAKALCNVQLLVEQLKTLY